MKKSDYDRITAPMSPVERSFYDLMYSIHAKLGLLLSGVQGAELPDDDQKPQD